MFEALLHGMGQLLAYFYSIVPNYGLAIIMLTVLVRTAMLPLAIKQAHLMQANRGNAELIRSLQPEVKKIREKYKDDRQKQYEEQKKLYEDAGVNMLGQLNGCLPVLLQMPIFFAMYAVLRGCSSIFSAGNCTPGLHIPKDSPLYSAIVDRTASFLGANLERAPQDVFTQAGFVAALPYLILVAVMGITMWYQTHMMMKMQPAVDPQMAATQKVMRYFPLMIVFFSWNFPAGLILYWSASNAWTIGQQWVLMRKFGEPPVVEDKRGKAKAAPAGTKGAAPKATGTGAKTRTAPNKGAGGAAPRKAGAGAGKGKVQGDGPPSGRRPAAKRARSQGNGTAGASKAQSGNGRGGNGTAEAPDSANRPVAGKPKGSGARKGNKGGRR